MMESIDLTDELELANTDDKYLLSTGTKLNKVSDINSPTKNNLTSLKIKKFLSEKRNFTDKLSVCANKLLFPKEMLKTVKKSNGLEMFYILISGYNLMIKDARRLLKQLKKVTSWGKYFFGTKNSWANSVDTVCIGFAKYQGELINWIGLERNYRFVAQNLLICYAHWYFTSNFITWLSISKENNYYISIKTFGEEEYRVCMGINSVQSLLPRFFNQDYNHQSKSISCIGYDLDPADLFDENIDVQTVICNDDN